MKAGNVGVKIHNCSGHSYIETRSAIFPYIEDRGVGYVQLLDDDEVKSKCRVFIEAKGSYYNFDTDIIKEYRDVFEIQDVFKKYREMVIEHINKER